MRCCPSCKRARAKGKQQDTNCRHTNNMPLTKQWESTIVQVHLTGWSFGIGMDPTAERSLTLV
jgi:hypothetical protein